MFRSRLFLITPPDFDPDTFAPQLSEALEGGDIACLLITGTNGENGPSQTAAELLTPIAQAAGVAALILNDTRTAGRARADGIHVDTGTEDLKLALETFHPNAIVGAGGVKERHTAMEFAELESDYVFFGMLGLEESEQAHPKTLTFAQWWAQVFEIPCVALAGRAMASVRDIAATRAEFVALRSVVWEHEDGPRAAIKAANAILDDVANTLALEDEATG